MFTTEQMQTLINNGGVVVDSDGDKVGKIGEVFLDDDSGRPEWVTAKTGLFGGAETFVPLSGAQEGDNEVRVAHDKATIKDAPRMSDAEGHLSPEQESELYRHYGLADDRGSDDRDRHDHGVGRGDEHGDRHGDQRDGVAEGDRDHRDRDGRSDSDQHDRGERDTRDHGDRDHGDRDHGDRDHGDRDHGDRDHGDRDRDHGDQDGAMVRSEERLDVSTERVQSGKARLRKYVVTENVTTTVPVEREEVRVEREPIGSDDAGDNVRSGGELGEDEQEVVLTEDKVTVDKETVPVEKVRVDTDTVTEDREVTEEVRKEQIDSDVDSRDADRDR